MFIKATIETKDLIIRPYQIDDIDALYQAVSTPGSYQYIPETAPTREDVAKIVKWSIDCNHKNTPEKIYKFNLAILDKKTRQLIGYCGLGPCDIDTSEVEIYYGLSEEYRGKGLATQAAKAVLQYGFDTIGLQKIVTTVHPNNLASMKILDKLQMKFQYELTEMPEDLFEFNGYHYYSVHREVYNETMGIFK